MTSYKVHPIGKISNRDNKSFIELEAQFIPALQALEGFRHINVLWWCSDFDNEKARTLLETSQPYKNAPETMGIFATRSPLRPNPIALTAVQVINIDQQDGIVEIAYIDAHDDTPVLDIKPYTPSFDRVEEPGVPEWCGHWPMSLERSADFAWEDEFNF